MANKKHSKLQVELIKRTLDYIEENNFHAGQHITEAMLVSEFNISRSPVRIALQYLEEKGIVGSVPNQGFFLKQDATSLTKEALNLPDSDEDNLYVRIAKERGLGELPDAFTESDFIRRYAVNRGALIRVLQRLSHDGLVEREKGYGWRFSYPLHSDAIKLERYRFRMALEPAAIMTDTFKIDKKQLAASKAEHGRILNEANNTEQNIVQGEGSKVINIFEMNSRFHEMLTSFSGNRYFLEAMKHQNKIRTLEEYKHLDKPDLARVKQSCTEHLEIITALEGGDREWAAQLLLRHISIASQV